MPYLSVPTFFGHEQCVEADEDKFRNETLLHQGPAERTKRQANRPRRRCLIRRCSQVCINIC